MEKNKKQWFYKWFHKENGGGIPQLGLLLGLGIIFLMMGNVFSTTEADEIVEINVSEESPYTEKIALEAQVAEILSQVEGAGAVQVMITYQDTGMIQLAREDIWEVSQSIEDNGEEMTTKSESTYLLTEDESGATSPFLLQSIAPSIEGIVIVAEGGGNAVVGQSLFTAAQALFDVPAHKIAVLQMRV